MKSSVNANKYTERPHTLGGVQRLYKFENSYGASVVRTPYSYGGDRGLWELAVIKYENGGDSWHLCYDTPITNDVLGHLSEAEVGEFVEKIKQLEKPKSEEV